MINGRGRVVLMRTSFEPCHSRADIVRSDVSGVIVHPAGVLRGALVWV